MQLLHLAAECNQRSQRLRACACNCNKERLRRAVTSDRGVAGRRLRRAGHARPHAEVCIAC